MFLLIILLLAGAFACGTVLGHSYRNKKERERFDLWTKGLREREAAVDLRESRVQIREAEQGGLRSWEHDFDFTNVR